MSVTPKAANDLVEQHQGLVHSIAARIHRRQPPHISLDDLVAYGEVGLVEAARDFDPTRGSTFATFAYYRIRGAIYDGISKLSWTSRARYNRIRYEQLANDVLAEEAEHTPASGASTSPRRESRWLADVAEKLAVVYLGTHAERGESRERSLEDPASKSPSEEAAFHEYCALLRETIDTLPEQAAALIRATYFEGLSLQEAGERIGISKS